MFVNMKISIWRPSNTSILTAGGSNWPKYSNFWQKVSLQYKGGVRVHVFGFSALHGLFWGFWGAFPRQELSLPWQMAPYQ
jgi:hypothetical protein